jgi:cation diffusion facilitator family transporter
VHIVAVGKTADIVIDCNKITAAPCGTYFPGAAAGIFQFAEQIYSIKARPLQSIARIIKTGAGLTIVEAGVSKKVKRVLWTILFINFGVAALKIAVGAFIRSSSLVADGFHSMTDGFANISGIIGLHLASKPADSEHPYGHGQFKTMSMLFISGALFFIAGNIIQNAIGRLANPVIPQISSESLFALTATLIVNIFTCAYEYSKAQKLKSKILISDAVHTGSDICISVGVLAALLCIKMGLPPIIDPIVSLIVSGFILFAAYEIFKAGSGVLLDCAAADAKRIRDIALGFEKVKDAHEIRSRGSGSVLYIDMHIMTEPHMSVEESHELIHRIEERLRMEISGGAQLIAHLEPFENNHPPGNREN